MKKINLPELLSPAGSPEAFRAAIDGGADAIYVGGASFNARINAKNFSENDLQEAIKLAHLYGVKVYQTVNIMIFDREMSDFLRCAESSANMGIDAFIVSDLGAASLLRKYLPEIPLHGSTQMSIHNSEGARFLYDRGFSRVVPARELSKENIRSMVENTPIEVEIFIHGAMCVSHSGQCLFSSLVGGRSGNRGLCAQPCRLPYASSNDKVGDKYPLSLKDMSLSSHVKEIIDSGVASLKIEGRMKSPEYVRGVTSIWRRLLDEGRDATEEEKGKLSELFSRGGFTDAYYTENIGRKMLGIRSEEDKQASRDIEKFTKITRKIPISMSVSLKKDLPSELTVGCNGRYVTVKGDVPQPAITAPIGIESVKKSMSKLGDYSFCLEKFDCSIEGELMMPVSQMNALRRLGIEELEKMLSEESGERQKFEIKNVDKARPEGKAKSRNVARFLYANRITDKARQYYDVILLPLEEFANTENKADGFFMPAVIFDSEKAKAEKMLAKAALKDVKYAMVSNLGQIELLKATFPNVPMIADYRFNIGNTESVAFAEGLGFESILLSPELTLPQIRDIKGPKSVIVYGRIPLMTLEKCVISELYGGKKADKGCDACSRGEAEIKDRRGFVFPVVREMSHRNILLNSLPTQMSDKQDELRHAGITDRHFIFTTEGCGEVDEITDDFIFERAPANKTRRI